MWNCTRRDGLARLLGVARRNAWLGAVGRSSGDDVLRAALLPSPPDSTAVWPEDPGVVPEWRLAAEARMSLLGLPIVTYRTGADFEAACETCEDALLAIDGSCEDETAETADRVTLLPTLPPMEAATAFIYWVRRNGLCGEYEFARLDELYLEHCADAGMTPTGLNRFKGKLGQLPGVERRVDPERRVMVDGQMRRKRTVVWVLAEAPESEGGMELDETFRIAA